MRITPIQKGSRLKVGIRKKLWHKPREVTSLSVKDQVEEMTGPLQAVH
jgi:hypothetical protein